MNEKTDLLELMKILDSDTTELIENNYRVNPRQLLEILLKQNILIVIDEPENEYEFVNLFSTIISKLKEKGEVLPDYLNESGISDDKTVIEILCFLNEYYTNETDKEIMILDNERNRYIIGIVPKLQTDKIYVLSFQLGIPMVEIESY